MSYPYSNYHGGCDRCGKILSQIPDQTLPRPCPMCRVTHYCSPCCFITDFRGRHRPQCNATIDAEVDVQGAQTLSSSQALWDLRKYTGRWRNELGDAAIDALNLHADPTSIDKQALVVYLTYIPNQWRRMQRFRLHRAVVKPLASLAGPSMDAAKLRREQDAVTNRAGGMIGCALIVLVCDVPEVGFIFNSTFVGPEPDLLVDPPSPYWEQTMLTAMRVNEPQEMY